MERPRASKEAAGPPQGLLKHLEAPSQASLETSLGPPGSPGTLQERSRDSLKGPKCQKKVPKAYQRPARRSLEAQEDRQRHESGPPSLKGRSKPANLQPQVPSVVLSCLSSNWATKHRSLKASSGLGGIREAQTIIVSYPNSVKNIATSLLPCEDYGVMALIV